MPTTTTKSAKTAPKNKPLKANNRPLPKFIKPKPIKVVTKAVLSAIADGIYNPETGDYLNLCDGTLQNGPDPVCEKRPMHCGLGELYFVITGHQPEDGDVDERDVVHEVVKRSTIMEAEKLAIKKIQALGLPDDLQDQLIYQANDYNFVDEFSQILDDIPMENDHGAENTADFKARAKRVAAQLRKAAALLPR